MSLIEQAARRLEELRRSGVASGEGPKSTTPEIVEAQPTPEAVVRRMESRHEAADVSAVVPQTPPERQETGPLSPQTGSRPQRPSKGPGQARKFAELDLEGLKARGFVTPDAPTTLIADEFRLVKRPIIENAVGRGGVRVENGNLVMVTSSVEREGKTFTALNLAISIAMEYDHTVLLVDGDVAKPALPELLGVPRSPGLLDLLTDEKLDASDAIVKTNIEKLSILPAGTAHRRSTELLASAQMANLLQELASRYADRIIIFDSPPILRTTEARVLASHMGQIIMVVAAESTSRNVVNQGLAAIESCDVVMMLLNKANPAQAGAYGYYYRHGGR